MDLYNGEIVAYETSKRPVFNLVSAMLKKVFRHISPEQKPMLHSDQGWQYQQPVYRRMLAQHGITQSMSSKANCLEHAEMRHEERREGKVRVLRGKTRGSPDHTKKN